jgi:hypothetical protein
MRTKIAAGICFALLGLRVSMYAASGTDGADFLNIPVGAEPAAMGGAYSALAANAYAPVWNPAGLGDVNVPNLAAQHLSYLESIHYEHLGFAYPLRKGRAVGASVQYLGAPEIAATDISGNSIGGFSSHYGAYSLSFGQLVSDKLSLGVTGKIIEAKIDSEGASAYAVDAGALYHATPKLALAGVVKNVGTNLTFIDQGDPIPLALHLGGAYLATPEFTLSLEGVYPKTGEVSLHSGIEWRPVDQLALRTGFQTAALKGLSPIAGFSAGMGIKILGQEFSYAWVPFGDLGDTHYVSVLIRLK